MAPYNSKINQQQSPPSTPNMEGKIVPRFRNEKEIFDCLKNQSSEIDIETLSRLGFNTAEKQKDDCSLFFPVSSPSHRNELKRLMEHWKILRVCHLSDPSKVLPKFRKSKKHRKLHSKIQIYIVKNRKSEIYSQS